jgi:hypothetical protein
MTDTRGAQQRRRAGQRQDEGSEQLPCQCGQAARDAGNRFLLDSRECSHRHDSSMASRARLLPGPAPGARPGPDINRSKPGRFCGHGSRCCVIAHAALAAACRCDRAGRVRARGVQRASSRATAGAPALRLELRVPRARVAAWRRGHAHVALRVGSGTFWPCWRMHCAKCRSWALSSWGVGDALAEAVAPFTEAMPGPEGALQARSLGWPRWPAGSPPAGPCARCTGSPRQPAPPPSTTCQPG